MRRLVQKYGGSSLNTPERVRALAAHVAAVRRLGDEVVVVVSAMGRTTDALLALARTVSPILDGRELDALLATGEQASAALFALALRDAQGRGRSLTAGQVQIHTDRMHGDARIHFVDVRRLQALLAAGETPVVTGFQGITDAGDTTTLGRGGSDLTAVAVAAALNADVCEIYTDVDGVYTADPRLVPDARRLDRIIYDDMLALARLGAKVLQARSVELAKRRDVPLRVRSSLDLACAGTLLVRDTGFESGAVVGVAVDCSTVKIAVRDVTGRGRPDTRVAGTVASSRLPYRLVSSAARDVVTVWLDDVASRGQAVDEIADRLASHETLHVDIKAGFATVSIVGRGVHRDARLVTRALGLLDDLHVEVDQFATSDAAVSATVPPLATGAVVRSFHDAFVTTVGPQPAACVEEARAAAFAANGDAGHAPRG